MDYFNTFSSNTLAGSGNQFFFRSKDETALVKSRTLYKIFAEGSYSYSFLFSNIIDSTFSNGSISRKNLILDSWTIEGVSVGISSFCDGNSFDQPKTMEEVRFSGQKRKIVEPGEVFSSDPVELSIKNGEYLCLEIIFSGKTIPYHEESVIPSFVYRTENGSLPSCIRLLP